MNSEYNLHLEGDIRKKLKGFSLDISFDAGRGCLGILGPSGCGKSMTLKSIAGIIRPDEGRIALRYAQGEAAGEGAPSAPAKYRTLFGAALNEKPEHMTHLKGNVLVFKDHPRIAFRGWIDALEAEILLTQQAAAGEGYGALAGELEEVLGFVRRYIRFDVLDEPVGAIELCGYTPEQLREYSHYPEKHFGQPHFLACYTDGPALLAVNKLRTVVRQTELAAYAAFRDADGNVTRGDMILGLNRLSSLMWIFMIKLKAGRYERK